MRYERIWGNLGQKKGSAGQQDGSWKSMQCNGQEKKQSELFLVFMHCKSTKRPQCRCKDSLRSICSTKCSGQKSRMTLGYLNIHFMRWWKYYGAIYYTSDDTSSSSTACSFQFCCPHLEDINQVQRVQEEMLETWKISILEQTARAIPTLDKKLVMEKE